MKIERKDTSRGFVRFLFTDRYSHQCSLQKSSLGGEDAIWLGVDNPEPKVMARDAASVGVVTRETTGWVPFPVPEQVSLSTRMHLTQEQVKELLPLLEHFAETGELPDSTPPASEQQQTVPRHKFEGLVEEVRLKDAEIARLAEQVMNLQAYRDGESGDGVWHWQGDGEDHLESLTCPIVIRAQDLRRLVASEQQRAVVMPEKQVEYVGDRDHKQWASGANWMLREFLRLDPHLAKGEGV